MKITTCIVIPVISVSLLEHCLKNLFLPSWAIVLIVNDGKKEIEKQIGNMAKKYNVYLLNLQKNVGFAKANNAGWKWLEKKFNPLYLGTLNADTCPSRRWVESLVKTIEEKKVTLATPRQKVRKKIIDYYKLQKNLRTKGYQLNIQEDTLTQSFSGFCFICRADHLKEVSYFDEHYINGCEDTDLALKFKQKNFLCYVSYGSVVRHTPSSFRFKRGAHTNSKKNLGYFMKKWRKGNDCK